MSDDIVTRLRAAETIGEPLMPWHVTPNEAADEIERLRAELKEAQNGLTWFVKIPNV